METSTRTPLIAYFCMEVGLTTPNFPTYSGGLGVLAGDTLRSAADLTVPMVAVTLVHRKGYFQQTLDAQGNQTDSPDEWRPEDYLKLMSPVVTVRLAGRAVRVRAWRFTVQGITGGTVPLYFLDTAWPENSAEDRELTGRLYGGGSRYRLCQEAILGLGGVAMLAAMGHENIHAYHMNEGHSALLALALVEKLLGDEEKPKVTEATIEAIRRRCVFTTHTPVPAGHDQFPWALVKEVLGEPKTGWLEATHCCQEGKLNMTYLALRFSHYINGVAMRHGDVSRDMFPNYPVNAITNGVHALNWTSPPFRDLFDRHIPEWRHDNNYLRYAVGIPLEGIRAAHSQAKQHLLSEVEKRSGVRLNPGAMTLGFARRATAYKRADLLFTDPARLRAIAERFGGIQVVYGGKAHPRDEGGKELIRRIFAVAKQLGDAVKVVYLEDYDTSLARYLCAGVDLWLNTPLRPHEASGTSGMKAAMNGVPSFSVKDGWWLEGHVEGVTGWAIGEEREPTQNPAQEAASLYDKLERIILPHFCGNPGAYLQVMRFAIALNGSFFNTQRMMAQYLANAYFPGGTR